MATVYLQPGTGTGTGTLADPYFYSQLSTAESAAGAGGTILFTDGTYSLTSASWQVDDLTYKSLNQNGAIIDGTVSTLGDAVRDLNQGSATGSVGTIIDGFRFIDFRINQRYPSGAGYINQILNCNCSCSTYLAFGSAGLMGGYWANNTVEVDGCSLHFKVYTGTTVFYDSPFTLEQTTMGVDLHSNVTSMSIGSVTSAKNTIFKSNDSGSVISGNIASTCNTCCIDNWGTTTSGGTDNIFQDPQLVDLEGGDLRLRPSSPCIGAATLS